MTYFVPTNQAYPKPTMILVTAFAFIVSLLALCGPVSAAAPAQKAFPSAEGAAGALLGAAKKGNIAQLAAILGPGSRNIISSGDKVADTEVRDCFVRHFTESHKVRQTGNKAVLYIGKDDWPFPLPIVEKGGAWRFDAREGAEEILNRRIGRNELNAIKVCLAYVDGQREYALRERDKKGVLEYARRLVSDPGTHNGLFWEAGPGEEPSPMGPLFAYAASEGYDFRGTKRKPLPYHGYFFRIIDSQGQNAPGGAYSYMAGGRMIGGFALLAYPARYGNSGVMSFMVNQAGLVYQKDLGKNTAARARQITIFDPDSTWTKTE